jgi:diaminopimelate epimerase
MKRYEFVKMHGAGNDFVLVDDRAGEFPCNHRRIAALAMRPGGIGCEGVIFLQKSECADFKFRFFNPDGTEADLCGNGARCIASFAKRIGVISGNKMTFESAAGLVHAEIIDDNTVKVSMPDPKFLGEDFAVAGVPHKIVVVENLSKVNVEEEGRAIRMQEDFAPDGTNVDFVVYKKPNRVAIRTYERGVESETGACGTGAVSAASIGVADYGLEFPVHVKTVYGYDLVVDGVYDGESVSNVTLTGPVKFVFSGMIDIDSLDMISE